jgi:hypothetical protein
MVSPQPHISISSNDGSPGTDMEGTEPDDLDSEGNRSDFSKDGERGDFDL